MDGLDGNISIAGLSVLLQAGNLDPVQLAETTLKRIAGYQDQAIFTAVLGERALAEAKASGERIRSGRSRGLLDGIPVAWKDLFDTKGAVTTAGPPCWPTALRLRSTPLSSRRSPRPAWSVSDAPI